MSPGEPRHERNLPAGSRWREPFSVLQTNLQVVDATMDVEAAADAVLDYGADTWLVNAGGMLSFYPTDLPFQTRVPLLDQRPGGDLLGDVVAAAAARGIKVVARFDMSKVTADLAARHPDWLYRSPSGGVQEQNGMVSVCPSGAYYQERLFDVLDEVLDRYDVDAVFFNWFNFNERDYDEVMHPPCHCRACHEGFGKVADGAELPTSYTSPTVGVWRRYTMGTLADLTARITDHVSARDDDVAVLLRSGAPIEYLEGNNAFRATPGGQFWPFATGEAVSAHMSSRPDAAVMVNCVAFVDATYRMGSEQPEKFAHHLVQTIARGGNPSAYYFGAPGRLPTEWTTDLGREVMRFHRDHLTLYSSVRPAASIALVRPDMGSAPRGEYQDVVEEFRGLFEALAQAHLPFDVLPVARLGALGAEGSLARYGTIVLPDLGTLRGAVVHLDTFVRGGGTLVLTGASGVGADGTSELASSPAAQVAGPAITGKDVWSSYATPVAQPDVAEHRFVAPLLPVIGRYQPFVWRQSAERVGSYLPKAPFAPPELGFGHREGDHPDHAVRSFGQGHVIHVPWTIGRSFREFGTTDVRDHFLAVIRPYASVVVTADIHQSVELVIGGTPDGSTVVHLLNHSGAGARSYGPHVPVAGGTLRVAGAAGREVTAEALVARQPLRARDDGEDLVIDLLTIDLFEVVRIDG